MKVNMKRYMSKTSVDVKSEAAIKKECFAFGYIDGYFDLEVYRQYIDDFGITEMYYAKGYVSGVNDRLRKIEANEVEYKEERKTWILNLAEIDMLNGVDYRKLSSKDRQDYESVKITRKK